LETILPLAPESRRTVQSLDLGKPKLVHTHAMRIGATCCRDCASSVFGADVVSGNHNY